MFYKGLSDEQEEHIDGLLDEFFDDAKEKYEIGALEHNSNLWENSVTKLVGFSIEEAIDQVVYLYTLRPMIEKLVEENKQLKQQLKTLQDAKLE